MGKLKDWAIKNSNSKFIKLTDGSYVTGTYKGFKETEFRGRPIIEYTLEIEGEDKIFSSSSGRLATVMDKIDPGTPVKITAYGEGTNRTYEVEPMRKSVKPAEGWEEPEGWDE